MQRGRYIFVLLAVAALFSSCEKGVESDFSWDDAWSNVFKGYMQFSTKVTTRVDKALNMRNRKFGVLGYQYSGTTNWGTAKPLATPKVFYNQKVECGETGICTYDIDASQADNQLKQWEDNSRYAFFAYHPYGGTGITLSSADAVGTPTLTYTDGWLGDANDGTTIDACKEPTIFDLMTAEDIECDGSKNVAFDFKHRLFAVEVLANNYNENVYEYEYEYETDDAGNVVTDSEGNPKVKVDQYGNPVIKRDENGNKVFKLDDKGNKICLKDNSQTIADLVLRIQGLKHTHMTIPLQDSEVDSNTKYTEGQVGKNNIVSFRMSNKSDGVYIPPYDEVIVDQEDGTKQGGGYPTSISKYGSDGKKGYVMLIPQGSSELDFALNWSWIKGGDDINSENVTNSLKSNMEFKAGKLYQIIINFVGTGVTIALIEAGSWDTKDVPYTFE